MQSISSLFSSRVVPSGASRNNPSLPLYLSAPSALCPISATAPSWHVSLALFGGNPEEGQVLLAIQRVTALRQPYCRSPFDPTLAWQQTLDPT
jgi:hypothetical protein